MLTPTENVTIRAHYETDNVSAGVKSYKVLPKEGAYLSNNTNRTKIRNFLNGLLTVTDCDDFSLDKASATANW